MIEFPDSGYSAALGPPPTPNFLAELRQQGITFEVGRSVVEADTREVPRILAVLHDWNYCWCSFSIEAE